MGLLEAASLPTPLLKYMRKKEPKKMDNWYFELLVQLMVINLELLLWVPFGMPSFISTYTLEFCRRLCLKSVQGSRICMWEAQWRWRRAQGKKNNCRAIDRWQGSCENEPGVGGVVWCKCTDWPPVQPYPLSPHMLISLKDFSCKSGRPEAVSPIAWLRGLLPLLEKPALRLKGFPPLVHSALTSLLGKPLKVLSGVLLLINNNGKHPLGVRPATTKFSLYRLTNGH